MATWKDVHAAIAELQDQLAQAKQRGDTPAEINALLAIADLCFDDEDHGGANMHYRLAEKVIRHSDFKARLHAALGGQGRVLRRRRRPAEALGMFRAARAAADESGTPFDSARWILSEASALRALGDLEGARKATREAQDILRPQRDGLFSFLGSVDLFDHDQVSLVAELEGQIGLTALAGNDPDGAEEAYRNAVHMAETAKNAGAIAIWSTNLGNALSRRRLYAEALQAYDKALAAARDCRGPRKFADTAAQVAACHGRAFRHEEGAGRLEALADETADPRAEASILEKTLALYDQAQALPKVVAVGTRARDLARAMALDRNYVDRLQAAVDRAQAFLDHPPELPADGPTALDLYLPRVMQEAGEGDLEAGKEAAHLICDIRLGLVLGGGDQFKRLADGALLTQPGLDQRALAETITLLVDKELNDAALELLQRSKASGFAMPTLARFQQAGAPNPEAEDYLAAAATLKKAVARLCGPARPDFMRGIYAVRRAGEALLECSERLRERDPILCARMGGLIRKDELIDALPYVDPVAIVDFVVGRDAAAGLVLLRNKNRVQSVSFKSEAFTAAEAMQLFKIFAGANLPAGRPGPRQAEALAAIGKMLHDRLFCSLTKTLSGWGVTQLVLVPDLLTRFLPLHLAMICGQEIQVAGVDTEGAQYLCEVMPTEYAPCLQAVAASQIYKRPKTVSRVAAFADPKGDLPAVRQVLNGLADRLAKTVSYALYEGDQAVAQSVNDAMAGADVLLFGTHGEFLPSHPEQSHLVLYDRPWRVTDVMDQPELVRNPVLVLAACQVGAVAATLDDRDAYGISGALIASGASTVLANLWKVEEVSMGYLLDRFLYYHAHPGYRPAAALFRAVRDMRRLKREDVLTLFKSHIQKLEAKEADDRAIISAENLMESIEDEALEHPFADPVFWGATIVVGSGWHLPAGAVVGGPLDGPELVMAQLEIDGLIEQGEYRSALRRARELAGRCDGVFRARALTTQALATLMVSEIATGAAARRAARRLLQQAERIARSEEDDDLVRQIDGLKKDLEA